MPARSSGVLYSKEKHGRGRKLSRPIDPPSAGEGLDFRSDSGAILKHIPPRSEAEGCGICAQNCVTIAEKFNPSTALDRFYASAHFVIIRKNGTF